MPAPRNKFGGGGARGASRAIGATCGAGLPIITSGFPGALFNREQTRATRAARGKVERLASERGLGAIDGEAAAIDVGPVAVERGGSPVEGRSVAEPTTHKGERLRRSPLCVEGL